MGDLPTKTDYEKEFTDARKIAKGNGHVLSDPEIGSVDLDERTHVPGVYRETCRCAREGCGAFVEIHRSDGSDPNLGPIRSPHFSYSNASAKYRCGLKPGELLRSSKKNSPTIH